MSETGHVPPGQWRPWAPWLALALWVASVVLGMQAMYAAMELYLLVVATFGLVTAQAFYTFFVCFAGLVLVAAILGSAEYHRTRIDQPQSWRLFAWVLGAELAIVLLHYFLL